MDNLAAFQHEPVEERLVQDRTNKFSACCVKLTGAFQKIKGEEQSVSAVVELVGGQRQASQYLRSFGAHALDLVVKRLLRPCFVSSQVKEVAFPLVEFGETLREVLVHILRQGRVVRLSSFDHGTKLSKQLWRDMHLVLVELGDHVLYLVDG